MGMVTDLFGSRTHPSAGVSARPDETDEIATLALDLLKEIIDIGDAGPGAPNAWRLGDSYARGYVFGFVYALLQQDGVADESQAMELITFVHVGLYGPISGARFADLSLSGQASDSVFGRGQVAGATDILRWLSDRETLPVLLADYLQGRGIPGTE